MREIPTEPRDEVLRRRLRDGGRYLRLLSDSRLGDGRDVGLLEVKMSSLTAPRAVQAIVPAELGRNIDRDGPARLPGHALDQTVQPGQAVILEGPVRPLDRPVAMFGRYEIESSGEPFGAKVSLPLRTRYHLFEMYDPHAPREPGSIIATCHAAWCASDRTFRVGGIARELYEWEHLDPNHRLFLRALFFTRLPGGVDGRRQA